MRNKILAITSLLVLLAASSSYAGTANNQWSKGDSAGTVTIDASGVGTGVTATTKVSANVFLFYKGGAGTNYSMATAHSSGSKSYATSGDDNRLYMQENAGNTTNAKNSGLSAAGTSEVASVSGVAAPPDVTGGAAAVWTGWSAIK